MQVFNRQDFTELWITIKTGESLAILDSGYVEDYFGVDGQLTLRNMSDDTRTSFAMTEDLDITPSVPHDAFTGFVDLTILPDGIYRVEGRVRDSLGNYRILSEVQSPFGIEDVTLFEIELSPLAVVIRVPKVADLFYVAGPEAFITYLEKPSADIEFVDRYIAVDLILKNKPTLDLSLLEKPNCDVHLLPTFELDILNVYTTI